MAKDASAGQIKKGYYKKALKVVALDTQAYYEFAKYVTAAYPVSCTVL